MSFHDTVFVPVPTERGLSLELFRDLSNKGLALTNLRAPRRIPAGYRFRLDRIAIATRHWSGDCFIEHLKLGTLRIKINDRLLCERELSPYDSIDDLNERISDNDDICGQILFSTNMPSEFERPTVAVVEPHHDVYEQAIQWPDRLLKIPFLRQWLPRWSIHRTTPAIVTRPMSGAFLVRVDLIGRGEVPVGR